jgi:uncharacterized protein (DUF983 family)
MNERGFTMFANRCAKCHEGKIFQGFMSMNEDCLSCGHHFEREEGFFMGSIILSYFASTLSILPIMLLAIFKYDADLIWSLVASSTVALITFLPIYRFSKIAWIHIEEDLYQSFKQKRDEGKRAEELNRFKQQ